MTHAMTREVARQPVIIIGMHRSGTSLITRVLEDLGLQLGRSVEGNDEALFFLAQNRWLLRQAGGRWDHPEPIDALLARPELCALSRDYLERQLDSPRVLGFLGLRHYLRYRSLFRYDVSWGWKDPRNTFTLPLWLEIFPGARILSIHRNGIDVAHSLRTREVRLLAQRTARYQRRKHLHWLLPKRGGFVNSPRLLDLGEGLRLWESYVRRAKQHVHALGERAFEFQYEDFLADPLPWTQRLCAHLGLAATDAAIRQAVAEVRGDRAFAYRQIPELQDFAAHMKQEARCIEPTEVSV